MASVRMNAGAANKLPEGLGGSHAKTFLSGERGECCLCRLLPKELHEASRKGRRESYRRHMNQTVASNHGIEQLNGERRDSDFPPDSGERVRTNQQKLGTDLKDC